MPRPTRHVWLSVWVLLALTACLVSGSRRNGKDDDDDDDEEDEVSKAFWAGAGRIIIFGVVSLIVAGLFSLTAWIVCSCHEKCRKRRIGNSQQMIVRPGKHSCSSQPPEWARSLTIQPELTVGFGLMSEGFFSLSNVQLLHQRPGSDVTDGAKWAAPLTTGKHLFEIIWPWGCRGYHATVGVATSDAPVKDKGGVNLVGGNAHSWGVDIVQRKAIHKNQTLCTCPTDGSYVPDRFLMYVDVDEGTLGFGNEVTYWGNVITSLPKGKPLFPMIGSDKWEANVQLLYRGSAGTSGFNVFAQSPTFDPYTAAGASYALPPLTGPMPPAYSDVLGSSQGKEPGRPWSAWEMTPPPPPPASAPPPYTSPRPDH